MGRRAAASRRGDEHLRGLCGLCVDSSWLIVNQRGLIAAIAAILLVSAWPVAQQPVRIRGFSDAGSAGESALEQRFSAMPTAAIASADFDVMTAQPHHVGSPYEIKLADYVADQLESFGFETRRYEYSVFVPWPGERAIAVVSPDHVKLRVDEEKVPGDPYVSNPSVLPAYNVYSPEGDVTGELVYVNYGMPADYDTLQSLGIDVKGRIVVARYGGGWRGLKPKLAAEHGAVACIIYSDPRDDGYFQGDVYPDGPYRGWGMVQRGSVIDLPVRPGDPSTPAGPSKDGTPRVPLEKIDTLAKIPVQPIGYRDGLELLKRLAGPVAPEPWRGALPVTYHIGPGPARVHVKLRMNYGQRRLINVVGQIRGSEFPDEWVIVGSHRDAWAFGAADSVSGHVSMMSAARAIGELHRQGWTPQRSILVVSWDGEEPGLLGSTEWVEDVGEELRAKAVVYINRDAGAAGPFFSASAVHSLAPFVHELASSVASDVPGKTVYDRWFERSRETSARATPAPTAPPVGALGSGSDYTAFLDHLGIASVDMGLGRPGDNGAYHSAYDHPGWFKKYMDPDFTFSVLAARLTGIAVLRFANADVLPFDYEAYGRQVADYVGEIEQEAKTRLGDRRAAIDFAALRAAADTLTRAGAQANRAADAAIATPGNRAPLAALNRRLMMAERDFIEPSGLPDRPWYRHLIYAPGLYTGYGVKTIPGVREAVEAQNAPRASEQAQAVVRALQRAAKTLSGE